MIAVILDARDCNDSTSLHVYDSVSLQMGGKFACLAYGELRLVLTLVAHE